jgi:hypothetical protein
MWATVPVAPDAIGLPGDEYVGLKSAPPVEEFASRLRAFVRVGKAFRIIPVLMTQPFARPRDNPTADLAAAIQDTFNDTIRKVGLEEDVLVIDLVRHFTEDVPGWDEPMAYFYDRIHANDRGSKEEAAYIAQRLAETILAPKLASKQSRPAAESHPESDGKRATGPEATSVEH